MMERRHNPRTRFSRNALIKHPRGFICPCSVDNISADGLFIRTSDSRLHKGGLVEVVIDASPHKRKPLTVKGLIIHEADHGIGLACLYGGLPSYFL